MIPEYIIKKYRNDPVFHALSKWISKLLINKRISLNDIQDAVEVAVELCHEEEYERAKRQVWIDE